MKFQIATTKYGIAVSEDPTYTSVSEITSVIAEIDLIKDKLVRLYARAKDLESKK